MKREFRAVEMAWLSAHSPELIQYRGEWIAIDGAALIAHGPDLLATFAIAAEAGHSDPLVTFIDADPENTLFIGDRFTRMDTQAVDGTPLLKE